MLTWLYSPLSNPFYIGEVFLRDTSNSVNIVLQLNLMLKNKDPKLSFEYLFYVISTNNEGMTKTIRNAICS